MRELLPYLGSRKCARAWNEVFSRDTLGSVVLGVASGKVVEKIIVLTVIGTVGSDAGEALRAFSSLIMWVVAFVVGVLLFVHWHRVMAKAEEIAEGD